MIASSVRLDRTVVIHARPATVFEFFTNSRDWAGWWGAGSVIDARPGGQLLIRHPNGVEVTGEVLELRAPERIVFTYGYASGNSIPPGGSRVTIRLDHHPAGTLLKLTHEFTDVEARDHHVQGWRYQLSLFANAVASSVNEAAAERVDRWFGAWNDPQTASRAATLAEIVASDVSFFDRFSCVAGLEDLNGQLDAVHKFMPGMRAERRGEVRHCQSRALVDWVALSADGQERGRGTNLFVFDADGRIAEVTGFWAA